MTIGTNARDALDDGGTKLSGGNNGNPQYIRGRKHSRVAGAAATMTNIIQRLVSLWELDGHNDIGGGDPGAAPGGAARYPINTTAGAVGQADATGGRTLYMAAAMIKTQCVASVRIIDRLADWSGFDATIFGSAQTTTGMVPTRHTDGLNNRIFLEIFTLIGATQRTITCSYKNENGVTHTTTAVAFGGANNDERHHMIELPLQAGDKGVTEVISVTIATGTTGTAGNFAVVIGHVYDTVTQEQSLGVGWKNFASDDAPGLVVQPGACISFVFIPAASAFVDFDYALSLVEE